MILGQQRETLGERERGDFEDSGGVTLVGLWVEFRESLGSSSRVIRMNLDDVVVADFFFF